MCCEQSSDKAIKLTDAIIQARNIKKSINSLKLNNSSETFYEPIIKKTYKWYMYIYNVNKNIDKSKCEQKRIFSNYTPKINKKTKKL